jgi:hypothetical protein
MGALSHRQLSLSSTFVLSVAGCLSYTRFALSKLRALSHVQADARFEASLEVANVGRRAGDDIVLAFVQRPDGGRQLVAFTRVSLGRWDGAR